MNDQKLREVFDYHGKERLVDGKSGAIGKNKDVPVHVKSFYPPGELARKAKLLAMLRACGVCIRKNHVDAALKEVGVRLKTRRGFAKPVRSVCVYLLFYQTHKTRVNRTGSRSTILKRCTRLRQGSKLRKMRYSRPCRHLIRTEKEEFRWQS